MRWTYSCPHCQVMLNPVKAVILVAEREDRRMLVGLHPEPGVYEAELPPGVDIQPGSAWTFRCPACQHTLESEENPELCALDLVSDSGRHRLLFSPVAGEQATFVITAEGRRESYGHDFGKYLREVGWGPRTA